jgi:hypothetical protein
MAFTDVSNYHLERAGASERLDPRRLYEQGIDRPSFGKASRGKTLVRDVEAEQAKAARAWEQRKAFTGIANVHALSREDFVRQVSQQTRTYERGKAFPPVPPEVVAQRLARKIHTVSRQRETLANHGQALETALAVSQMQAARSKDPSPHLLTKQDALLAHGERLGLPGRAAKQALTAVAQTDEGPEKRTRKRNSMEWRPYADEPQQERERDGLGR